MHTALLCANFVNNSMHSHLKNELFFVHAFILFQSVHSYEIDAKNEETRMEGFLS